MKTYYVLWTYVANYSRLMPVEAEDAEDAIKRTVGYYGDDFSKKATVCVFDTPPAILQYKGERMNVEQYREVSRKDG